MALTKKQLKTREYNQRRYWKTRNNPVKWAAALAYSRKRFSRLGHKKIKSKCIVCGKIWMGVMKLRKFCSQKCVSQGSHNGRWKGGRQINNNGYLRVYSPGHPYAVRNLVSDHRLVMEKHLGRILKPKELVHHKNGRKTDNRLCNLQVMTAAQHASHHFKGCRFPTRAVLTKGQRNFVIRNYKKGRLTSYQIADKFGVSQTAIVNCYERFKNGLDY